MESSLQFIGLLGGFMSQLKFIAPLGAAFCLSLAVLVTGCVENSSLKTAPIQEDFEFETSPLFTQGGSDNNSMQFHYQFSPAHKNITKTWSFSVDKASTMLVTPIKVVKNNCQSKDKTIIHNFNLLGADNTAMNIDVRKAGQVITPGNYKLKLNMQNPGLCETLDLFFTVRLQDQAPQLTSNIKAAYSCNRLKNKAINQRLYSRVETLPMKMVLKSNRANPVVIHNKNIFCEMWKLKTNDCKIESYKPIDGNIIHKQKQFCLRTIIDSKTGVKIIKEIQPSYMSIFNRQSRLAINFGCAYRGKRYDLQLSGCEEIYNLGARLPITTTQGLKDFSLRILPRKTVTQYKITLSEGELKSLPPVIYMNFFDRVSENFVLPRWKAVSREEFLSGEIHYIIRHIRVSRMLHRKGIKNLAILFSANPDIVSGIYFVPLNKYCRNQPSAIQTPRAGIVGCAE